jgi:hypothetical protein
MEAEAFGVSTPNPVPDHFIPGAGVPAVGRLVVAGESLEPLVSLRRHEWIRRGLAVGLSCGHQSKCEIKTVRPATLNAWDAYD